MKRYWYSVDLVYKNAMNKEVARTVVQIGFHKQREVLDYRKTKCRIAHILIDPLKKKRLLCGGRMFSDPIAYLGYFDADHRPIWRQYFDAYSAAITDRFNSIAYLMTAGFHGK